MLTWFRAHAPVATALVVFVVGSGGIASHATHAAPVAGEHDATAHRMSTAAAEGHRLDCLACSWTRSLRQRVAVAFIVAPAGAAPSRPVIRGLDGDRVLILKDGQRTGDLSSQSGDQPAQLDSQPTRPFVAKHREETGSAPDAVLVA